MRCKPNPLAAAATLLFLAPTLSAQCHQANLTCPLDNAQTQIEVALHCVEPSPITVHGVTVRSRHLSSNGGNGTIGLWLADPNGRPTQRVASGRIFIGTSLAPYRGCFDTPVQLPANQDFAIEIRLNGALAPRCDAQSNAVMTTYHWRQNASASWRGPFSGRYAFGVECSPCTPTLIGNYSTIGSGCPGTAPAPRCAEHEMSCASGTGQQSGASDWALPDIAHTSRDILGVTLRTRSISHVGATGRIELWIADANGFPQASLANARITIGPSYGNYTGTFIRPIRLPAGTPFAVGFRLPDCELPICSSGTAQRYFQRSAPNSIWNERPASTGLAFSYRTECRAIDGLTPYIAGTQPRVDAPFTIQLANAKPSSLAFLAFGSSKSNWVGLPLPFNLGLFGAPACQIACSGDIVLPLSTDPLGSASATVDLAGDRALVGTNFCNQWFVVDPGANPFGLVVSNCGEGTIGG